MPISFKHFLTCIYHDEIGWDEDYMPFEEWIWWLTYKDLCDYWEEYIESSHATIYHLFRLK